MTTSQAVQLLKTALLALEQGNTAAARQIIAKVIAGLIARKHK